ncbi:hypothetical protein SDC9_63586 [bioreactor metagenome]|uniref:Uncharacterized protein n=1 Tax=bioreactor metagenome TaxID=1076179 RepID=A0A644XN48_9ZZZZ
MVYPLRLAAHNSPAPEFAAAPDKFLIGSGPDEAAPDKSFRYLCPQDGDKTSAFPAVPPGIRPADMGAAGGGIPPGPFREYGLRAVRREFRSADTRRGFPPQRCQSCNSFQPCGYTAPAPAGTHRPAARYIGHRPPARPENRPA